MVLIIIIITFHYNIMGKTDSIFIDCSCFKLFLMNALLITTFNNTYDACISESEVYTWNNKSTKQDVHIAQLKDVLNPKQK